MEEDVEQMRTRLLDAGARLEEMSFLLEQAIGRSAGLNRLVREQDQQMQKLQEQNMKLQEQLREQERRAPVPTHPPRTEDKKDVPVASKA